MSKNINNMSFLQKIIAVVVSMVLIASLLGSGTYFLVNHINNSRALSGTISSIGNMLKDGNTVNYSTYQKLLTALGNDTTSTRTAEQIRTANGNKPVVFQMGTINNGTKDVPIYWQVVYQVGDIITIWMTDCYTTERYNSTSSSYTISSKNLTLLQTYVNANYKNYNQSGAYNTYSQYANYSQSTLRDLTKAIYGKLSADNPVISKVVKSPNAAGATWQATTTAQPDSYYTSTSYKSHHNALQNPSGTGYYTSEFVWDTGTTGPYYDNFWIPSWYETMNDSTSTASLNGGKWRLTAEERGYNDGSDNSSSITSLDGTAYNNSSAIYPHRCWLRSGYSNNDNRAMQVNSSGSADVSAVIISIGVRPAAHISLTELYNAAPKISSVTLDQQNGMGGTTSVTATNGSAMPTITPPTREHYTFGGYWTGINGTGTQYYTNTGVSARNWDKTGNATLYAYWIIDKFNITLNSNNTNYGTILNSGGSIDYGTTYTSYAIAQQNCAFLYWLDSSNPNTPIYQNPLTITVTENKTYTAYFTNSLIDGVVCVATVGGEARIVGFDAGDTEVTFIAVAYSGYKFDGWFVKNGSTALSTDLSCRLPMSTIDDKIIVARFSKITGNINDSTDTPDSGFV